MCDNGEPEEKIKEVIHTVRGLSLRATCTYLCGGHSTLPAISQIFDRGYYVPGSGDTKMKAVFPEFMGLQSGEIDQNVRGCNLVFD